MRELSVYDSGAWKKPGYAYVYRDGSWVRATEIHMFRKGAWTSVWDQQTLYVPSASTTLSLTKATQNRQPDAAYWKNTLINGRMLGDINNSGSVTTADANIMLLYVALGPSGVTADQQRWIEVAIIPYVTDTPLP